MLNMHRPSDQAKLLFFALLRGTVSALATETKVAAGNVNMAVKNAESLGQFPNIQLRLARRADVPSIQRCNLATLPENYNSQFYVNHIRQWPDLCLVAEDTMACSPEQGGGHNGGHNNNNNNNIMSVDRPFGGSFPHIGGGRPASNVVAYVLGKVEERPRRISPRYYTEGYQLGDGWDEEEDEKDRFIGHVTSLAVMQPYRRKGLAAAMMKQLHFHLKEVHGAGAVGLHVRKSNQAACRLYQERGYAIDLTIPGYYQDGEDAYFMNKPLLETSSSKQGNMLHDSQPAGPKFPFLARRPLRPWESGPMDLRLPRDLAPPAGENVPAEGQSHGLLTGGA